MRPPLDKTGLIGERLAARMRDVPDFPKPVVLFKDIRPILGDAALIRQVIAALAQPHRSACVTHVAGVESRGFILGAPVAVALRAAFIPIRKSGKLPGRTVTHE